MKHSRSATLLLRFVPQRIDRIDGPVDEQSGLLIVREDLDRILSEHLVSRCDHRNLDDVIGPDEVSTGENLARIFFDWVEPQIPAPARLARLRVYETPRNVFEARAEGEPR
jgi:6-pyruvoyltetrahydropterin/6-carboxytetrahydropterin synthase